MFYVGTASWSIPSKEKSLFPSVGTHLERYGAKFNGVEINTSFYRPHKRETYQKWANCVPEQFRFSVKMPKRITHELRFKQCKTDLEKFMGEVSGLSNKLGCLLVQTPPSLEFSEAVMAAFWKALRDLYPGPVAFEPRHASWNSHPSLMLLKEYRVGFVFSDPPFPRSESLKSETFYARFHGSPKMYYSEYSKEGLQRFADLVSRSEAKSGDYWCIFDNTALGFATRNALEFAEMVDIKVSSSHYA